MWKAISIVGELLTTTESQSYYPIQETSEVQTPLNSSQNRREKHGNEAETVKLCPKWIRF